jgi:carbamoyl-phosphate synthase small subunit
VLKDAVAMTGQPIRARKPTGVLVLADGTALYGQGFGLAGSAVGEVCFNTAITGYQEVLTDPSYAAQIVAFTAPHVGNIGANGEDVEAFAPAASKAARGCVVRADVTAPSSWRADGRFDTWCEKRGIVGLSGVDTRALTHLIRENGMPHGVIAYDPAGAFDLPALAAQAAGWNGLKGWTLQSM